MTTDVKALRERLAEKGSLYTSEQADLLDELEQALADLAGLAECRERVAAAEWDDRSDWSGCGIDGIYMTAYDDGRWYASSIGSGDAPDLTAAKAAATECAARLLWAKEGSHA